MPGIRLFCTSTIARCLELSLLVPDRSALEAQDFQHANVNFDNF
jgi:hypothetical protein